MDTHGCLASLNLKLGRAALGGQESVRGRGGAVVAIAGPVPVAAPVGSLWSRAAAPAAEASSSTCPQAGSQSPPSPPGVTGFLGVCRL